MMPFNIGGHRFDGVCIFFKCLSFASPITEAYTDNLLDPIQSVSGRLMSALCLLNGTVLGTLDTLKGLPQSKSKAKTFVFHARS